MSDDNIPQPQNKRAQDIYSDTSKLEAHIIADMLRIESITVELREFKTDMKARLDKLENWIIGIVSISVVTLLATVGSLLQKVL